MNNKNGEGASGASGSAARRRVRAYLDAHGSDQQDYLDDPMGALAEFCWKHPVYTDDLNDLLLAAEDASASSDSGSSS